MSERLTLNSTDSLSVGDLFTIEGWSNTFKVVEVIDGNDINCEKLPNIHDEPSTIYDMPDKEYFYL